MAEMTRFQAEMEPEQLAAIELLAQRCGFRTKKELMNNALTLLAWVSDEVGRGRSIVSLNETNSSVKELSMPFFAIVQRLGPSRIVQTSSEVEGVGDEPLRGGTPTHDIGGTERRRRLRTADGRQ